MNSAPTLTFHPDVANATAQLTTPDAFRQVRGAALQLQSVVSESQRSRRELLNGHVAVISRLRGGLARGALLDVVEVPVETGGRVGDRGFAREGDGAAGGNGGRGAVGQFGVDCGADCIMRRKRKRLRSGFDPGCWRSKFQHQNLMRPKT